MGSSKDYNKHTFYLCSSPSDGLWFGTEYKIPVRSYHSM